MSLSILRSRILPDFSQETYVYVHAKNSSHDTERLQVLPTEISLSSPSFSFIQYPRTTTRYEHAKNM